MEKVCLKEVYGGKDNKKKREIPWLYNDKTQ